MASDRADRGSYSIGLGQQSITGAALMWVDRLLWAEGVILGQQQFQQWDAYLHQTLTTHLHTLTPHHWGVLTYVMDEQQLTVGEFTVQQCRAIFPNGILVHYQAQRQLPLGLSLTQISADQTTIYLGLPRHETASGIAGYPDPPCAQWQAHYQTVTDQFDADKQREVLFGRPALRLLTDEDDLSPFLTLPLAQVSGMNGQQYQLTTTFVPACCQIRASTHLESLMNQWQQALQQKLIALTQQDERSMEMQVILSVTRQAVFQLQQLRQNPAGHPWQLYQTMGQWLMGTADLNPPITRLQLPVFSQDTLTPVFASLNQWVQQRLTSFQHTQQTQWMLQPQQPGWWNSGLLDSALLEAHQCWLLVSGMDTSKSKVNQFIELTKVAATQVMPQLLAAAMPGIPLQYHGNKANPSAMESTTLWFALDLTHAMWRQVITQRQLTVHISQTDAPLQLKLLFK